MTGPFVPAHNFDFLLQDRWSEWHAALRGALYRRKEPTSDDDVETLMAEVLAEALPKAEEFDSSECIIPWLMGFAGKILQRRPRFRAREQRVRYAEDLEELIHKATDHQSHYREELETWLDHLSAKEARLIRLRYFEGLTSQEIAAELELKTVNAACLQLTRALQRLREIARAAERED